MQHFIKKAQKKESFTDEVEDKPPKGVIVTFVSFIFVWIILGFSALVMSLICFGRSGTIAEHIVGLILAFFFGPFYWIYFIVAKSYCRAK